MPKPQGILNPNYDWLILPLCFEVLKWRGLNHPPLLVTRIHCLCCLPPYWWGSRQCTASLKFLLHHPIFIPKSMLMKNLCVGSAVPKCVFLSLYLNVLLGLFHFCKKKLIICWQALVCIFAFLAFHKIEKIINQPRKIC